jgi:hypothetical protein
VAHTQASCHFEARREGMAEWHRRLVPQYRAFLDRFARRVDPHGVLPEEVRTAWAKHARIAYILQLAERSAAARQRRGQPSTP